jgi:hypothetical protein
MTPEERKAWEDMVAILNDIRLGKLGAFTLWTTDHCSAILAADLWIKRLEEVIEWANNKFQDLGAQHLSDELRRKAKEG